MIKYFLCITVSICSLLRAAEIAAEEGLRIPLESLRSRAQPIPPAQHLLATCRDRKTIPSVALDSSLTPFRQLLESYFDHAALLRESSLLRSETFDRDVITFTRMKEPRPPAEPLVQSDVTCLVGHIVLLNQMLYSNLQPRPADYERAILLIQPFLITQPQAARELLVQLQHRWSDLYLEMYIRDNEQNARQTGQYLLVGSLASVLTLLRVQWARPLSLKALSVMKKASNSVLYFRPFPASLAGGSIGGVVGVRASRSRFKVPEIPRAPVQILDLSASEGLDTGEEPFEMRFWKELGGTLLGATRGAVAGIAGSNLSVQTESEFIDRFVGQGWRERTVRQLEGSVIEKIRRTNTHARNGRIIGDPNQTQKYLQARSAYMKYRRSGRASLLLGLSRLSALGIAAGIVVTEAVIYGFDYWLNSLTIEELEEDLRTLKTEIKAHSESQEYFYLYVKSQLFARKAYQLLFIRRLALMDEFLEMDQNFADDYIRPHVCLKIYPETPFQDPDRLESERVEFKNRLIGYSKMKKWEKLRLNVHHSAVKYIEFLRQYPAGDWGESANLIREIQFINAFETHPEDFSEYVIELQEFTLSEITPEVLANPKERAALAREFSCWEPVSPFAFGP